MFDPAAARARCEAAAGNTGCFPAPWRAEETTIFARDGAIIICCIETDEIAEFVAHAVTDLPAALEALEEAQGLPTDGEICDSCGSAVAVVWHARDEEWKAVVGSDDVIRCPRCFVTEAEQKGLFLAFITVPLGGNWTTGLQEAQAENARLQAALTEAEQALAMKAVVMVSGEMVSKAEYEAVKALAEEIREAGWPIARHFDAFCRLDHHGSCQSHLVDKPCSVVRFRRALSMTSEEAHKEARP